MPPTGLGGSAGSCTQPADNVQHEYIARADNSDDTRESQRVVLSVPHGSVTPSVLCHDSITPAAHHIGATHNATALLKHIVNMTLPVGTTACPAHGTSSCDAEHARATWILLLADLSDGGAQIDSSCANPC